MGGRPKRKICAGRGVIQVTGASDRACRCCCLRHFPSVWLLYQAVRHANITTPNSSTFEFGGAPAACARNTPPVPLPIVLAASLAFRGRRGSLRSMDFIRKDVPGQELLDRREFELSLFSCFAILVLAARLALLMYPAVFSRQQASRTTQIAF